MCCSPPRQDRQRALLVDGLTEHALDFGRAHVLAGFEPVEQTAHLLALVLCCRALRVRARLLIRLRDLWRRPCQEFVRLIAASPCGRGDGGGDGECCECATNHDDLLFAMHGIACW